MKLAIKKININPEKPCFMRGYIQRDHPYESIHDDIFAIIFVLSFQEQKMAWVMADLVGFSPEALTMIRDEAAAKGVMLNHDNFIIGATHTHSAPSVSLHEANGKNADPEYISLVAHRLSDGIVELWNQEGEEVEPKYSSLYVDGLYSNRNDPNKWSDKKVNLIGFFHGSRLKAVYSSQSCHNTAMGPKNYAVTGDFFGLARPLLEEYFGCPVMMAQGNAGDMGNRQYRKGQEFPDVEEMAANFADQVRKKHTPWESMVLEPVAHKHIEYEAVFDTDIDAYQEQIDRFQKALETETDYTQQKVLLSGIAGLKRKVAAGRHHEFNMPADIYNLGELQIVTVPAELGSVLGQMIKDASKAKYCIVWGYVDDLQLSYMVEAAAFDAECQETNVTKFPRGEAEKYIQFIIENL